MTKMNLCGILSILCVPFLVHGSEDSCTQLDPESWINDQVVIEVHRNGEIDPCGTLVFKTEDLVTWNHFEKCPSDLSKYDVESFLSSIIANKLTEGSCLNEDDEEPRPGFSGYCDRGEEYTPILTDHQNLVPTPEEYLPCRFFTREGARITSLEQFTDLAMEKDQVCSEGQVDCGRIAHLHVYAVSAGRVFMFAPSHIGEVFELDHVSVKSGLPVYLEVLNLNPRVFDVHNFFTKDESADLVERALAETSETHKIKRSTTGTGEKNVYSKRTSDNGFDTHGETAKMVKRRCMEVLGFDEYIEGHTDGLQILRYNQSKDIPHMDYMEDKGGLSSFDFESQFKGGNRFATILLYMTDMEEGEGGETVFPKAWPPLLPESERKELEQAISDLRASGDTDMLEKDSWEEKMVAKCRSKFSVRPNSARAVLFYSQFPNGAEDPMSKHGGCPVLTEKPKWAANLWAWNTPRDGFPGAPRKWEEENKESEVKQKQVKATFTNSGKNPDFKDAKLYWESTRWGDLGFGSKPLIAYTFAGHTWNIKVNGETVKHFTIENDASLDFVF